MTGGVVAIAGPAHRVAIVGAILAKGWPSLGRNLVLMPQSTAGAGVKLIARPDHLRVHAEIGLSVDRVVQDAAGSGVLSALYESAIGPLRLPFAAIGASRGGVDFQHYWARANAIRPLRDLPDFSIALALETAVKKLPLSGLMKAQMPFGLSLDRDRYAQLLLGVAKGSGAQIVPSAHSVPSEAVLTIDCDGERRSAKQSAGWTGQRITVATRDDLPGIDWQLCVNAARRLLSLASNLDGNDAVQCEYSRLSAWEGERIADMHAVLISADPHSAGRSALSRKLELFAACGRIPTEDFEVFSHPEWLCALWARGIRPRRFDRMANVLPERELLKWIAALEHQIDQIAKGSRAA
ncbi:MAG: tryptophan 7-halogenase [Pseudomonadota bacterium]|nr:tryptophan 7-halogenase [Pseudomonadota bacterium]